MPRAVLPRLVAVLVAAAGLVLLVVGVSRAGSFAEPTDVVGRLPQVSQQVVVTAPGMTEVAGATLRVQASAADPARPVFIGVGRADDVQAYLGSSPRAEITALRADGRLRVVVRGAGSALPDPATVDVWAAAVRSQGAATLSWPRTPGAWRLVVSTDGTAPPATVRFTWSGSSGSSPAPALIAVGAVLLIAGVVALLAIRSGRIFAGAQSRDSVEVARRRARQQRVDRSTARAAAAAQSSDTEPAGTEPADEAEPGEVASTEVESVVNEPAGTPDSDDQDDRDDDEDDADEAPVVVQPFRRRGQGGGPQ